MTHAADPDRIRNNDEVFVYRSCDLAYAAATARTGPMPEFRAAEPPAPRAFAPASSAACRRDCETCAPSRNGLYRVCVADSLEGLDALKETWETLERQAGTPLTPFQSFAFCRALAEDHAQGPSRLPAPCHLRAPRRRR